MVLTMSRRELRRFVLHFFHCVFNVHDEEFPSIFTETYPDIDILGDTYLTDEMQRGVLDTLECHITAMSNVSYNALENSYRKLVIEHFSEENLYYFLCIHAWNCVFGNLSNASLIDDLELVVDVFTEMINSEKFTSESWEKLSLAGLEAEKDGEKRLRDIQNRLRSSSPHLDACRNHSPPVEDEPVTKKPKVDLQSESTCVEMSETELLEVKTDRLGTLEETENETMSEIADVVMQEDENEEFKGTEESEILKGPDEKSQTKISERLKISKKSYDIGKSKRIAEPETIKEIDNETESKKAEESESVQESIFIREAEKFKEPEMMQGNETKKTEECETELEIGNMQKNKDKRNAEKIEESEKEGPTTPVK